MAEGFQVPMVAYALDVPTTRVLAPPTSRATAGRAPDVILQTRATQSSTQLPRCARLAPGPVCRSRQLPSLAHLHPLRGRIMTLADRS